MYKKFYLMQKEPFDSHPSPELFYKSLAHQNGWAYLVNGIRTHEPILLVEGDYGAGKTLLYLKLIRLFRKNSKLPAVFVSTPAYNFVMVLEKVIEKLLGIPPEKIDTSDDSHLQRVIYEYFENQVNGQPEFVYIVIDDAQEFSYSFVNKLRLFVSYNVAGRFPIRMIMFSHHSFLQMLEYKKLAALGQRIKRIYHLRSLNFEETREYIYFRLIHSGASGAPVFDDDAIRMIQAMSQGNPRLINNICDNCLLVASEEKSNLIHPALVRKTMAKGGLMGIKPIEPPEFTSPEPPSQAFAGKQVPMQPVPTPGPVSQQPLHQQPPMGNAGPQNYQMSPGQAGNYPFSAQEPQTREPHYSPSNPPEPRLAPQGKIPDGKTGRNFNLPGVGEGSWKKKIVISTLLIIILFLAVYIINNRQTKEEFELQGSNYQINRQIQAHHSYGKIDVIKRLFAGEEYDTQNNDFLHRHTAVPDVDERMRQRFQTLG